MTEQSTELVWAISLFIRSEIEKYFVDQSLIGKERGDEETNTKRFSLIIT